MTEYYIQVQRIGLAGIEWCPCGWTQQCIPATQILNQLAIERANRPGTCFRAISTAAIVLEEGVTNGA